MYRQIVDNEYVAAAGALIDLAEGSIDLSTFKLQYDHTHRGDFLRGLIDKLLLKIRAGVKVRCLMNWDEKRRGVAKTNGPVAELLKREGADVRFLEKNRCCHSKLLIIDGRRMILGSHNWSNRSVGSNFEISLEIDAPEVIKPIQDVFLRSFCDARKFQG